MWIKGKGCVSGVFLLVSLMLVLQGCGGVYKESSGSGGGSSTSSSLSQPAGLVVTGVAEQQVNLKWLQSTKRNSDGSVVPATAYDVYRNGTRIGTATETTYVDTTAQPGTHYTYYIVALDGASGTSAGSIPVTVLTDNAAGVPSPGAPSALAAQSATAATVTLTWTASNTAGVTYTVYRGSTAIATGLTGTVYADATVVPATTYVYTVAATKSGVESVRTNALSVAVPAASTVQTAPSVPRNFVLLTPATGNAVALGWSPSIKTDGDRIVAGYDILRSSTPTGTMTVIAQVTTPGYTDTSILPAATYYYAVKSYSSTGVRSDASTTLTVVTGAATDVTDTAPPAAPANLRLGSPASSHSVPLVWDAAVKATGDHSVAGYRIYRNGQQIADWSGTSYIDSLVTASTAYSYVVKAYDNAGNLSAASNTLSVTTPAAPAATYILSGRVTTTTTPATGIPGVTISIIGDGTGTTFTDSQGYYSLVVSNGTYNVAPSMGMLVFSPNNQTVVVAGADKTAVDFTATTSSVTGGITYPSGSVTGGITYPPGTIIGGVTYPAGTVIGGVTYPTSTVIGGVTYPTGSVIGGITYPNGVVIGGIAYPPGTVVGGVAFPPGTITAGVTFPDSVIIGGVRYPTGTVVGGVITPGGTVIGGVTYPSGTVIGGVEYPAGRVAGGVTFPTSAVTGTISYPTGTIIGGITYPAGTVIGGVTYPTATVIGGVTYPTGTVIGGITYPDGVVIGGITYPPGTVVGGVAFPPGTVTAGLGYPTGTVIGGVTYPTGTVVGGVIAPSGTAIGTVSYPSGTIIGGTIFPSTIVTGGVVFPSAGSGVTITW